MKTKMWKRVAKRLKEQRPEAAVWVQHGAQYFLYPNATPQTEITLVKGKPNILVVV